MCNVVMRRWHARLRKADELIMLPEIEKAVARQPHNYRHMIWDLQAETPLRDGETAVARLWAAFKRQRGQEHWRCACAHDAGEAVNDGDGDGSHT